MPRDPFVQLILDNIQPHHGRGGWHGGPTPVGAVRGVKARQARWIPSRGRKSIWDLTLHVAYWNYAVRRRLEEALGEKETGACFPRTPSNWARLPDNPDDRAWREDCALMRLEHQRLLDTIARIPRHRYASRLRSGKRWTLGELILGIAIHDAYHAGQIQMLKRMWAGAK